MEKVFQLMMAPLLLVTVSRLPAWAKVALPLTIWGAVGLDQAGAEAKQVEMAATIRRLRAKNRVVLLLDMIHPCNSCRDRATRDPARATRFPQTAPHSHSRTNNG